MRNDNILIAASDGDLEGVQYFLASGSSVADQDDLGYSVFHAAASYNHLDLMRFLLEQPQADAGILDADGDSPLHVTETVDMAQLLLGHSTGGKRLTEIRNSDGQRPIEVAYEEGFSELVDFLKEFSPDFVPVASNELQPSYSEAELEYLLSAADLHTSTDNVGDATLSINLQRLQELVQSGQLNGILEQQRRDASNLQEKENDDCESSEGLR